tara:strand:- start:98 stop:442 length:345 start_codon:yes stop_codon:yes gene_type:complete
MKTYIEKFEIKEVEENLYVMVEVPHEEKPSGVPRIIIKTNDIIEMLAEKGIKHGPCLQDSTLKNWRENNRKKEWIFEKFLDKAEKRVILEEKKEIKSVPKKKKKTPSRRTTKKS